MLNMEVRSEVLNHCIQEVCASITYQLQGAFVPSDDEFEQKFRHRCRIILPGCLRFHHLLGIIRRYKDISSSAMSRSWLDWPYEINSPFLKRCQRHDGNQWPWRSGSGSFRSLAAVTSFDVVMRILEHRRPLVTCI